ncbi:MOSC domain-containing protein [Kribbella sp. NBC_01245]|uniref:MOSC domain-containing protein n=1 Tax=Kribbella sp. NBC_01245 TaxID=2903578 RepID=UPI002E2E31A5|nr:MOSC N-terminal beta barrel domain-containing protein [Kribbella sp. NBC_01245]
MARIAELWFYPVKGLAGISVEAAEVGVAGVRFDRELMLVDPRDGVFHSQRTLPAMAAVRTAVSDDGAVLRFSVDGAADLVVEVAAEGPRRDVSLFGKWFGQGVDQDPLAGKWFTEVLDRPATLVRVTPEHHRPGWGVHPGQSGFGDAHALLITSPASLDELNSRILETGGEALPMNRFRPNLVVSGWPEPHTEDKVLKATIGAAEIGYSSRSIRCAVPTIDQTTGVRSGPEPTRTLATYRREPTYGGGVSFGMKAAVLTPGVVSVGDEFVVTDWLPEGPDPAPATREPKAGQKTREPTAGPKSR